MEVLKILPSTVSEKITCTFPEMEGLIVTYIALYIDKLKKNSSKFSLEVHLKDVCYQIRPRKQEKYSSRYISTAPGLEVSRWYINHRGTEMSHLKICLVNTLSLYRF